MDARSDRRRKIARLFWRFFNPLARPFAGYVPWWVVLETTGRRSGEPRRAPLARGPIDGSTAWLISVHGESAFFARNIAADPHVRLKFGGRWRQGTAELVPMDPEIVDRFNLYARSGPRTLGIDPRLVRIELGGLPS